MEQNTALITGASRVSGSRSPAPSPPKDSDHRRPRFRRPRSRPAELADMTRVVAIPGDVRNEEHRRALAGAARGAGGLDALVNNASILGPSPQPALLDYPLDALEEVYAPTRSRHSR